MTPHNESSIIHSVWKQKIGNCHRGADHKAVEDGEALLDWKRIFDRIVLLLTVL